ncbi:putative peptidase YgaJ [Streptomyces canarius]
MALVPGRRVVLLGGGFSTDEDGLLDDWLLTRAGNPRPRVCFLPTASGDAPGYVDRFLSAFRSRACVPAVLPLFRRELDDDALRAFLLAQDVVYVGGGNTANMLAVWRVHGVDRLLREACDRGTLLCGISAGANCWADASHTDSFGPLASLRDGLGLLPRVPCARTTTANRAAAPPTGEPSPRERCPAAGRWRTAWQPCSRTGA